jgi:oligosaccharyltransferase complex subunit beta
MKTLLSLCVLLLAALAAAISSSGSRLLVVLDDLADKASYSKFLGDLESECRTLDAITVRLEHKKLMLVTGRSYQITYETPKSESLQLFHLGERTYDHIVFLPTKVKGTQMRSRPHLTKNFSQLMQGLCRLGSQPDTQTSPRLH